MSHHACYSLTTDFLDIVLIEDSKPMQMILRSMLTALRAQRVRVFDNPTDALKSMLREPPNLILTDWRMPGMSGYRFLRAIRTPQLQPLCFVPVIVVTAHATEQVIHDAMRAGAHMVMVKPVSPSALYERINWLLSDKRQFVIGEEKAYVLDGTREKLSAHGMRMAALARARQNPSALAAGLGIATTAAQASPAVLSEPLKAPKRRATNFAAPVMSPRSA